MSGRFDRITRRLGRRLPTPVRTALGRSQPATPAESAPAPPVPPVPQLSVVVAAESSPEDLTGCLDALRASSMSALEILVVARDDAPALTGVVERVGRDDPRVGLVVVPAVRGLNAARNAGAARARGDHLAFVADTDRVTERGLAALVATLGRTGSDFAAGATQRMRLAKPVRPDWVALTHDVDRLRCRVADFPTALHDTALSNRVFRREFWTDRVGGFPEAGRHAEVYAVVAAMLAADQFDLLKAVVCVEHPGPAAAVDDDDLDGLADRLHWLEATRALVRAETDPVTAGAWLGRLVDGELGDLAAEAAAAPAPWRDAVAEQADRYLRLADDTVWPHVRVERKLRLWLAAERRWPELEELTEHFRLFGAVPATRPVDGRLYARASLLPGVGDDVPQPCLELSAAQTALSGCVERVSWTGDVLRIDGWAFIRGLDLHEEAPHLEARWVALPSGAERAAVLTPVVRPAANRWARFRYADVAPGGFTVELDTADLPVPKAGQPGTRWQLVLTVTAAGLSRTGPLTAVVRGGSAGRPGLRDVRRDDDPVRLVPQLDPELGFVLQTRADRVRASTLTAGEDGQLAGTLLALDPGLPELSALVVRGPGVDQRTDLRRDGDAYAFALALPVGGPTERLEVRAVEAGAREHRVSWPADTDHGPLVGGGPGRAAWARSPRGFVEAVTHLRLVGLAGATVDDQELTLDVRLTGLTVADLAVPRLVAGSVGVTGSATATVDGRGRLRLPLRSSQWGGPVLPLPSGDYRLRLPSGVTVEAEPALLARWPEEVRTSGHAVTLRRTPTGADLVVTLEPPLDDDERGRYAQDQLALAYAAGTPEPADAVLFQSYKGEFCTDSQRAISDELVRRGRHLDLDLIWTVADLSVPVPEGTRGLVLESRAWYEALARSRYLCRNIDVERYFRKRPYQRYLQTFHGYPFKSMGASLWRTQGRPESVIAREAARRSRAWDAIVVPAEFCVELYRREYAFTGRALVTGYPRDDALVSTDPDRVRERVLSVLGIDPAATVVLYAPTWRDTNATSAWTAKLFDALDLAALTARLGPGFAVLLRGHNYNLREGVAATGAGVWDVTAYPEVNDLVLASDVAVLDYSSLRFDWALTGKPMLFFVPDLEDYLESRTVLFDFAPTAPGPLLRTTEEVAAALLDLDAVAARYAAARKSFDERFNARHDGLATKRVVDAFFE